MKSFVITMTQLPESITAANRCRSTAASFGVNVDIFEAITPKDDPLNILCTLGISSDDFSTTHSRKLNGISCFLSHYMLWQKSIDIGEPIIIFEHHAVIIDEIPTKALFNNLLSIGKPSFGSYNIPKTVGVNALTSKPYLPGAHAYIVKPTGAIELIARAKIRAKYADTFMNKDTFPWIEEYYPWPVICDDSFTTIQHEVGCKAKHNYKKDSRGFRIL